MKWIGALNSSNALQMLSVPKFLVGMFRNALKMALEEIVRTDDEVTQERGWKLFLMLARMLLHRPPGESQISSYSNVSSNS